MPNEYKDEYGHFTSKENDGGKCHHNGYKQTSLKDGIDKMVAESKEEPKINKEDYSGSNINELLTDEKEGIKLVKDFTDKKGEPYRYAILDKNNEVVNGGVHKSLNDEDAKSYFEEYKNSLNIDDREILNNNIKDLINKGMSNNEIKSYLEENDDTHEYNYNFNWWDADDYIDSIRDKMKNKEEQDFNEPKADAREEKDFSDEDVENLKKKIKELGIKNLSDLGYLSLSPSIQKRTLKNNKEKELLEAGFSEEDIKKLEKYYTDKQNEKNKNFKDMFKNRFENEQKKFFGDDVKINRDIVQFSHYKNDDNITIVSGNVQFWKNKGTYVMWVGNGKVVYLKDWQVKPVKEYGKEFSGQYAVKLDRKYYKPYKTYENENYAFDKEDTFDDLVQVAKSQDKKMEEENIRYKIGD